MRPSSAFYRFVIALSLLSTSHSSTASTQRPNVLLIVADDLGWNDVGFRSKVIHTPNIDVLASGGVVLEDYYVHTVCSPTRASMLTGRFSTHHSIYNFLHPFKATGLPLKEVTLAQKFKEAGYATHMVGKWHLGFYKWEFTPTFRGFDSFMGFYHGGEDYFKHSSFGYYDMRRDPSPQCGNGCSEIAWDAMNKYSTTIFSEEAVKIVDKHSAHAASPLFLYLAYQAVHSPAEVPKDYLAPYENTIADFKRRKFAAMLSAMDEGIGNVTAALKRNKLVENTLIIFSTDNGGPTTTDDGIGSRNWPLRGGKHSLFEGGVRGTAMVHGWGIHGRSYSGLMHAADWLPTLSEVAGYRLNGTLPLDGKSHWKLLSGQTNPTTAIRREVVHGVNTDMGFAIRQDEGGKKWKLVLKTAGQPSTWCNSSSHGASCAFSNESSSVCKSAACLYQLDVDKIERFDLAGSMKMQQVFTSLKARAEELYKEAVFVVPDKSCPPFPVASKYFGPWC